MNRILTGSTLACVVFACGPSIKEQRVVHLPPRDENCTVEVVQASPEDLALQGRYEVIGNITLRESGVRAPFDPEYLNKVRPHACAMGAEVLAVAPPTATSRGSQDGSTVAYSALRVRVRGTDHGGEKEPAAGASEL